MNQSPDAASPRSPRSLQALFSGRRWARVPRQTLFLLSALPLALSVPVIIIGLVSVGTATLVLGIGIVLLLGAAAISRILGALELRRLEWAGAAPIEPPDWPASSGTWFSRLRAVLLDPRQWSYIAHGGLYFLLGTLSGCLALLWVASIANGATRWLWHGRAAVSPPDLEVLAASGPNVPLFWWIASFLQGPQGIVVYTIVGAAALVTLPWFTAGMVGLHERVARVFLGRYSPAELEAQVAGLRQSRRAGVNAEGRSLRRLERDLHDGPQQRLLRLQLDLASARRKIDKDPEAAARLMDEAGRGAAETLAELRNLVRGIAPPILQDRGLLAALEALAERSPIASTLTAAIDPALSIEPAVQQGVYFVIAELLANAAKHSKAGFVTIDCRTDPAGLRLTVEVKDDGIGGAIELPGHGLSGLGERIEGLGGTWSLRSPQGGPTTFAFAIPL